jgi:7,8-dihydropterin-6-yl-methyl-4-(beta-D-ribofuranosyl)aminobenzene 5'-phosphate synthase
MLTIRCLVEDTASPSQPFKAEHGVSFHVETPAGQVLFDTGASGAVLLHNADLLGIDLAAVDALAISHAHDDHTGGLRRFMDRARPDLPLYASPDLFRPRYTRRSGERKSIGLPYSRSELEARLYLCLTPDPVEMLPGVWTTGEIMHRRFFEGRGPNHHVLVNGHRLADPYRDDLSLVVEADGGLVVVCGCCHAGLLNTLDQVCHLFEGEIVAVLGGTHLVSADDDMLAQAVDALRDEYGSPMLYVNHCTGQKATAALAAAFGDRVQPCPAGTTLTF